MISRPVDLARLLVRNGLSLKKAHSVLDRIAAGQRIAVELRTDDLTKLILELQELDIDVRLFKKPNVDAKRVREGQHLSQPEFVTLYGLELDTLQNWEQGRNSPDTPAMVLLKVIEQHPEAVLEAITEDATRIGDARRSPRKT